MIGPATSVWAALWRRLAPTSRLPVGMNVRAVASDAPLRAAMAWRPDWKTAAIGAILRHRTGTLIDVGANVGQTLFDFLSAPVRSSYLGFEPNLTCVQHLTAFIAANRVENCTIIPAALGERSGVATLYRLGGDVDAGATTMESFRPRSEVLSEPCCVYRLDDLSEVIPEAEVALIKIDVEGTELEVLRGMDSTLRRTQPWVMCEVLHRDELADEEPHRERCIELMKFLRDEGYEALRIVQDAAGTAVRYLESVDHFPAIVWNEDSTRSCDYIFLPRSDVAAGRKLLAP